MRKVLVIALLTVICLAVGALFWYNEFRYHLPTPVPVGYKPVPPGTKVKLTASLDADHSKPLFLHFFNPDCPCSRFNIANFKALVKKYSGQVNFVVVVINNDYYTAKQIQNKFDLSIPVLFDASLAKACGVYSTPQAALLDNNHNLYYRGNYNRSRYCTDEKTSYAKLALDGLLNEHKLMSFSPLALKSYGCSLPNCAR